MPRKYSHTTYWIDLDYAYDENNVEEALARFLKNNDLTDKVTTHVIVQVGPGGGWPIVRFSTDSQSAMHDVIVAYAGGDMRDAVDLAFGVEQKHVFKAVDHL